MLLVWHYSSRKQNNDSSDAIQPLAASRGWRRNETASLKGARLMSYRDRTIQGNSADVATRPHQSREPGRLRNAHPSRVPSLGREPCTAVSLRHSVLRFDRAVGRIPSTGAQCETSRFSNAFSNLLYSFFELAFELRNQHTNPFSGDKWPFCLCLLRPAHYPWP